MSNLLTGHAVRTLDMTLDDTAFRLLELQQRLDAWDRLCSEEVRGLRKELSLLTASYMQECQARRQTVQPKQRRRREQMTRRSTS
jgi:hypothetical protein